MSTITRRSVTTLAVLASAAFSVGLLTTPAGAAAAPGSSYNQLALSPTCGPQFGDSAYHCRQTFTTSGYTHDWSLGTDQPVRVVALGGTGGASADGTAGGLGGRVEGSIVGKDLAIRIGLGGAGDPGQAGGAGGAGGGYGTTGKSYAGGNAGKGLGAGGTGGGGGGATVVATTPALTPALDGGTPVVVAPGGGGGSNEDLVGGDAQTNGWGALGSSSSFEFSPWEPSAGGGATSSGGGAGGVGSTNGSPGVSGRGGDGAKPPASTCSSIGCLVGSVDLHGAGGGGGGVYGGGGGGIAVFNIGQAAADDHFVPAGGGGGGYGSSRITGLSGSPAQVELDWTLTDNATTTATSLSRSTIAPTGSTVATAKVAITNHPTFPVAGSVQFLVDGKAYGAPVAVATDGSASLTIQGDGGRATHQVSGVFTGAGLASSTSTSRALMQGVYASHIDLAPQVLSTAVPSVNLVATTSNLTTGTVSFFDGGSLLKTLPLVNQSATLPFTVTPGTHSITATYSGDAGWLPSSSTAVTLTGPTGPTYLSSTTALTGPSLTSSITVLGRTDTVPTIRLYVGVTTQDYSTLKVDLVAPNGVVRHFAPSTADSVYRVDASTSPIGGTWQLRVTSTSGAPVTLNQWSITG